MYLSRDQANQFSGGIFMIGLALLFLTNYWWPGIMFVIGASTIAQGMVRGRSWYSMQGALWTIGIGLVFAFGFNLPLLFLLIGGSMVFGSIFRPPFMAGAGKRGEDDDEDDNSYIDSNVDVYEDEDDDPYAQAKRKRS
ncbi:MAG TPA: hypothetical protein VHL11_23610 [Phototrophicaceae bacterium]|jgi:hypothetical protein|nr:hypothetical protein [Phototrophicaceae bacterium]